MCRFSLLFCFIGSTIADSWNHASKANCRQGVDVVFLQDTTLTFKEDLPIVTDQAINIMARINSLFPHSQFGVAEFKDKPFDPLGVEKTDYCYRLVSPLSGEGSPFRNAYSRLSASGGGDYPEASYQALINVAYDSNVGWRPFATSPKLDATKSAARIIVFVTDARPHMAGDMAEYPKRVPQLPGNPGTIWQDKFDEFCATYDYPHFSQVGAALRDTQTAVIFLIKDDPRDPTVFGTWDWFNREIMKQPSWFIHKISKNSSDISQVIVDIMQQISTVSCEETTTTEEPTTTTTTTSTTTTTTTTEEPSTATERHSTATQQPTIAHSSTASAQPTLVVETTGLEKSDEGSCDESDKRGDCGGCCGGVVKNQYVVNIPVGNDRFEIDVHNKSE